jgi:hypothetical protein
VISAARGLAILSVAPPAGKGTIYLIGKLGKFCAKACTEKTMPKKHTI